MINACGVAGVVLLLLVACLIYSRHRQSTSRVVQVGRPSLRRNHSKEEETTTKASASGQKPTFQPALVESNAVADIEDPLEEVKLYLSKSKLSSKKAMREGATDDAFDIDETSATSAQASREECEPVSVLV